MVRVKADLHVHSTASDGKNSPVELVLEACRREFQVLSITDHDTFRGSIIARRKAREMRVEVLVIVGAEIRTRDGDVLVLCEDGPPHRVPFDVVELIDVAHESGCLVIPAHPFDVWRHGIGSKVYEYRWDAIEVFNARSDPLSNRRAQAAAEKLALPGIACSDAHVLEELGAAYTIVEVEELSEEEVLRAIRAGRVTPVPGRPGGRAVIKHLAWSLYNKLASKRGRGRSEVELEPWGLDEF